MTDTILWLVVIIVTAIFEGVTTALVSIWFTLGGLVALILAFCGAGRAVQIVAFIVVSIATLFLTKPLADKWINSKRRSTNVTTMIIGKSARVTEEIDNGKSTGAVYIDGKTWTARNIEEKADPIPIDSFVHILSIDGVKLMVTADTIDKKEEE